MSITQKYSNWVHPWKGNEDIEKRFFSCMSEHRMVLFHIEHGTFFDYKLYDAKSFYGEHEDGSYRTGLEFISEIFLDSEEDKVAAQQSIDNVMANLTYYASQYLPLIESTYDPILEAFNAMFPDPK